MFCGFGMLFISYIYHRESCPHPKTPVHCQLSNHILLNFKWFWKQWSNPSTFNYLIGYEYTSIFFFI